MKEPAVVPLKVMEVFVCYRRLCRLYEAAGLWRRGTIIDGRGCLSLLSSVRIIDESRLYNILRRSDFLCNACREYIRLQQ
jgi:hypothetical protein